MSLQRHGPLNGAGDPLSSLYSSAMPKQSSVSTESDCDGSCVKYNRELPVTIASLDRDRDDRSAMLTVRITLSSDTARKTSVLRVELVDACDPLFLYILHVSEADFHILKQQQNLLVDFSSFPAHLIRLLDCCVESASHSDPKHIARLDIRPTQSRATFTLLETNRFRYLHHLELEFLAASDAQLKESLSSNIKQLKATSSTLHGELDQVTATLHDRESKLEELNRNYKALMSSTEAEKLAVQSRFNERLAQENAEHAAYVRQLEAKFEDERRALIADHKSEMAQLANRVETLQNQARDQAESIFNLNHSLKSLQQRFDNQAKDLETANFDVKQLRATKEALDHQVVTQEKEINKLSSRVAFLEQQIVDKDDVLQKTNSLLEAAKEQKSHIESSYEMYKENLSKSERRLAECANEIKKGNQIIQSLRNDLKNVKAKLKLKGSVIVQQESVLLSKDQELQSVQHALADLKAEAKAKEIEAQATEVELRRANSDLEKSKEVIETNTKLIAALNQQITELQLKVSRQAPLGVSTSSPYTFRPSSTSGSAPSLPYKSVDPLNTYPGSAKPFSSALSYSATLPLVSKPSQPPVPMPSSSFFSSPQTSGPR